MGTSKSLCQTCVYTVHVPMISFVKKVKKFHLFEPWNLFAKLSWAHVHTVNVPMIILVKRGQKLRSGARGVYFWTPKSLLRLPHLWKLLNLLAKFPHLWELLNLLANVSAILCSYDYFCEKEQIMHRGKGGGAFFNPKILIKSSPSMGTTKSLCQAFPNTCFCSSKFLRLVLWKGGKIV